MVRKPISKTFYYSKKLNALLDIDVRLFNHVVFKYLQTTDYPIGKLTEEEFQAAMNAINEIKEEKARQARASAAKKILDEGIAMMIDLIGIEQTKMLLRDKNRELIKIG